MDPEARAQRAANNKSLRIIKNELEALVERGFITDDQFDTITAALPAEQSLNVRSPLPTPQPTPTPHEENRSAQHQHEMHIPHHAAPPSYQQAQGHVPPPPPPREKQHNEVGHAVALWAYTTEDSRDLDFAAGDHISITEFVNAEWWQGQNCRTNQSGIFPANYVRRENYPSPLAAGAAAPQPHMFGGDYKAYPAQQTPQYGGYQQPSHNPYHNPVPPVAIAEGHAQPQEEEHKPGKSDKVQEMGKKFGGKLGNAAIFGAGATIGSNIVNSIF